MSYRRPFELIRRDIALAGQAGDLRVSMPLEDFVELVKSLIATIPFDQEWYLASYDDIAEEIAQGMFSSAQEHFVEKGYFESRLPSSPAVDEAWYLRTYTDVAASIEQGVVDSGYEHYLRNGYKEGRQPGPLARAP